MILDPEPIEPTKHATLTSGIFRRELVHAPEPTSSVVIWVAGVSGDSERYDDLVEVLNRGGFDVLRFGGWRGETDLEPLTIHDVLVALEDTEKILHERGYATISYVGKSFGGLLGLLSRNGYDRTVLWAPLARLGDGSDPKTRISELSTFTINREKITRRPTLIISGTRDEIITSEEARGLADALSAQHLEVNEGHSVDKAIETLEATLDYLTEK